MAPLVAEVDLYKYQRLLLTSGCSALPHVARLVAQFYDTILAPVGLRVSELGILRVCGYYGPIDAAELARQLATNRAAIVRDAKPLVARGMLQRCTRGKSRGYFELTASGRRSLAAGVRLWDEAQKRLIDRLGEARWNRLRTELSALVDIGPTNPTVATAPISAPSPMP